MEKIRVDGVLDEELDYNKRTTTTANLKTLVGDLSNSESEDKENFTAENRPRPPPEKNYTIEMVRHSKMHKMCLRDGMSHQKN